jgi:beta-mannosidase
MSVRLVNADGTELDRLERRVGFRNITLDTEPDEHGVPLTIAINGADVLVRGVNWIPDDAFVTRVDAARYRTRIEQAAEANCNLLRIWGGGIYEPHEFYDVCDDLGVLVWQDFLFTCAGYSEEEPLRSEVDAEAREAVATLCSHPSLVLWCGGNEDIAAFAEWPGWQARLNGLTWGAGYYEGLLPNIVAELDPTRPYIPNSPYSFGPYASPSEPSNGDTHIWDVWNDKDYTAYADWSPRFASEFGFQGPATWTTLTRVTHDSPLRPDGPQLLVHQKAGGGNDTLRRRLAPHLPVPEDFGDWHWATQLNQARAVEFGVSHFRALAPRCSGSVLWQLNDCWPVISWSVIDGDGRRKPAWYALRHAHADRLLVLRRARNHRLEPIGSGLELAALDDHVQPWTGQLELRAYDLAGAQLYGVDVSLDVAPRTTQIVPVPAELIGDGRTPRLLTASAAGARRATWWTHEDMDSGLPAARLRTNLTEAVGGYQVRITADTMVKDLALLIDRVDPDGCVDDALLTLLPGEQAILNISSAAQLNAPDLVAATVLRTANDLVQSTV